MKMETTQPNKYTVQLRSFQSDEGNRGIPKKNHAPTNGDYKGYWYSPRVSLSLFTRREKRLEIKGLPGKLWIS